MGVLSFLTGSNPVAAIADSTIGKVVDKALSFIPDPVQKAQFQMDMRNIDLKEEEDQLANLSQQIAVNIEEAKSQRPFEANARPFIIWIGGIALGYSFILQPFATVIIRIWQPAFMPPSLDIVGLLGVVAPLLGVSYLRSQDKQAILDAKQGDN